VRLTVTLRRAGRAGATRRVTARRGRFAVGFRVRRPGRYRVEVRGAGLRAVSRAAVRR
jgi:hypothetical protein